MLLHQWDVERALIEDARLDPKTIDYRDKQAMLRKVAYRMQSSEKGLAGNLISSTDLEAILTDYLKTIEVEQARTVARLFINQLRTRNFILCFLGADSYGFVHRTFLEYFCAWEFVWQFKETQTLTIEQLINELFGKHWQDESWHEVLRLICGMIDVIFADEIINYLIDLDVDNLGLYDFSNLLLASKCFEEIRNQGVIKNTSDKLLDNLKSLFQEKKLQQLKIERQKESSYTLTILSQAATAISKNWKDDQDILHILELLLRTDQFNAIQILVEISEEKPEALSILRKQIQPMGKGLGNEDFFSTLRSRITDVELLKATLQDLNIPFKIDADARGGGGLRTLCDIVAVLTGDYDIGFTLNSDGSYDIVASLWGVAKAYNQTTLINCINFVYHAKKARKDLQKIV